MRKCKYCKSIWVCWNWIHSGNYWGHECWDCGDDISGSFFDTKRKVKNGITYWILKNFHKYFSTNKEQE